MANGAGYGLVRRVGAERGSMNETTIQAAFEEWWRESYGMAPGKHAVMTHTAFAAHILQLLELMQEVPTDG